MTRKRTTSSPPIQRNAIDASIRRIRRLRSQYLTVLLTGLVKKIVGWNRKYAPQRRLENMPDYLLKDIGIERDQIDALVSGSLRQDPLAQSPAGSQHLTVLLTGLVKKIVRNIVRWNQRQALHRHLHELPDYLLKDIGIRRDQVGAIVSGSLRRDPLALSPAGSQSAPAFQGVSAPVAKNSNSEPDRQLAA